MRFNVYVDGFNLYYGALRGRPYRWLDIRQFAQRLLRPDDELHRIRYFTARVRPLPHDLHAPRRQATYIRALETLPDVSIHFGRFLANESTLPRADGRGTVRVIKSEEKGSDVNLATHLLLDACAEDFEAALVVSNDSDLTEPVLEVQARYGRPVGLALPLLNRNRDGIPRRPSRILRDAAAFVRHVSNSRRRLLAECQFPETLTDARGSFSRPPEWA